MALHIPPRQALLSSSNYGTLKGVSNYDDAINRIHRPLSFDSILTIASNEIKKLNEFDRGQLHDSLDRGTSILQYERQLYGYLYSYGKQHQERLNYAFEHLPKGFFSSPEINIIDYGCGQALGTMCYADYLRSKGYSQKVKTITLIEPSYLCLMRAVYHASLFFPNAFIRLVNKKFDKLTRSDFINNNNLSNLHILSNVLDLDFDLEQLANLLKESFVGHNQFVCVGPSICIKKDNRIHEFARSFISNDYPFVESHGELLSNELDPNKEWTCVYHCFSFIE